MLRNMFIVDVRFEPLQNKVLFFFSDYWPTLADGKTRIHDVFLDTNAYFWLLVRYDMAYMASHSPSPLLIQLVYIDTSPLSSVHTSARPAPKHSPQDRRLSVRMIAEETDLNKNAVHRILIEHLHIRKICAKLVPKNLSVEQKANRLEIYQALL